MGVELEGSLRTQECTTTVGYQIDLQKSNLTFRGLSALYTSLLVSVSVSVCTLESLCTFECICGLCL